MCDNTPPAYPYYLNYSYYSWPSDLLVVSLISGQWYFTSLHGHTRPNIHNREGGRKEIKQTRTWVSSKCKKGEVCDTFLAFCKLSRACIRAKFLQIHKKCWHILLRWPIRHLSPLVQAPALFCRLVCSLPWSLLPSSVDSRSFLPSSSSGLWEISRTSPLCGFHAKTDKRIFWLALTDTHITNAQHRVSHRSSIRMHTNLTKN